VFPAHVCDASITADITRRHMLHHNSSDKRAHNATRHRNRAFDTKGASENAAAHQTRNACI